MTIKWIKGENIHGYVIWQNYNQSKSIFKKKKNIYRFKRFLKSLEQKQD